MSVLELAGVVVLFLIACAFLNRGPVDRQSKRSEAYWARFEK